eukprot:CAMPEP_0197309590 /NCGR_PEP_ID=MMETSP0891-20130614/8169_1 /TAXON_ID=44058 ORGANISM="Aureoumbra lagunensis, Strain CCMP1510" /NCGR_SAMPLE_ID=MMETSP0891 /ASSEMBLY_ACC=CAM_ASM_000534 /LENGTH=702 /DNA_ID=CAMNT_0042794739 /DNA_START=340 /DNA_END=2448 /DNA_ORIENTATION=+
MAELPRVWYIASQSSRELDTAYAAAAVELANLKETTVALAGIYADAMCTLNALKNKKDEQFHALKNDCEQLKQEYGFRSHNHGKSRLDSKQTCLDTTPISALRRELAIIRAGHVAALGSTEKIKSRVFYLQDVSEADQMQTIHWTTSNQTSNSSTWWFHCRLRPWLNRAAALFAAVASASLATSELGAIINGRQGLTTSAFAVMIRSAARNKNGDAAAAIAAVLCIAYLVLCAAYGFSLLKIRGYIELNFKKKTPPRILSFTCRNAGKLAPALLYNFLSTLHEVGSASLKEHPPPKASDSKLRTAFDRFYSAKLDAITTGFDKVVALLILGFCILHLANMLNRILIFFKLGRYQFGAEVAALDNDQIQEGKERLDRDRKRLIDANRRDAKRNKLIAEKSRTFELTDNVTKKKFSDQHHSPTLQQPPTRNGWLIKKNPRGNTWKRRFFVLRPPAELVYFKKEIGVAPSGIIDLRLLIAIHEHENGYIDLELPDRSFKLKADGSNINNWIDSINAWREYAALQGDKLTFSSSQQNVLSFDDSDESTDETRSDQEIHAPLNNKAPPNILNGDLRVKKAHSYRQDEWETRYAILDQDGFRLFLSRAAAKPILSIDLRFVADISPHNKGKNSDPSRFSVDHYKFQAIPGSAAQGWIMSLRAWQDYLLLHHTSATTSFSFAEAEENKPTKMTTVLDSVVTGESSVSMV